MAKAWQKNLMYDLVLGYVRNNCVLPGIDIIGGDSELKILALGGTGFPPTMSWPYFLRKELIAHKHKAQILSGVTEGYVSGQELLMLIRDGLLLSPTHVVTLSGQNNFCQYAGINVDAKCLDIIRKHPFVGAQQVEILNDIKTALSLKLSTLYYGVEDGTSPAENWVKHMILMHNLCCDFGIGFTAFLQPCVWAKKTLTKRDLDFLTLTTDLSRENASDINIAIRKIYEHAKRLVADKEWIIDLSESEDLVSGKMLFNRKARTQNIANLIARHVIKKI